MTWEGRNDGDAGMTWKGNSSPGNANLRIGTQAGHDENSHSDSPQKYALRRISSAILTRAVTYPNYPIFIPGKILECVIPVLDLQGIEQVES